MDTTDAIKMNPSEKLKQFAISELERVERCKNSTLEAMVMFPNVAEYIVQVEKERDELRRQIAELERDKTRFDWLEDKTNRIEVMNDKPGSCGWREFRELYGYSARHAIDTAMEQELHP